MSPGRRPRLLWITTQPPATDGGGANIRQASLLRALAEHVSIDLVVIGRLTDEGVRSDVTRLVEIPDPRPRVEGRARTWWSVFRTAEPAEMRDLALVRRSLTEVVARSDDYDVVNVEQLGLAPLLPEGRRARWAITLHHLASVEAVQQRARVRGTARRAFWWREARFAAAHERRIVEAFDYVAVPSVEDADHLPGTAHVVPNGVDVDRYRPTPIPSAPNLVFTGTLDYRPNIEGVVWFCSEVLPLVRAAVPDVRLDIVGHGFDAAVARLAALPGVAVQYDVPTIAAWLERARVAIVPLHVGSGTRLKALEAMAAGRPVVGTTVGLNGFSLRAGHDAVVVDEPTAMASALVRLLRDDELARRLAVCARSVVEEQFDWRTIGATYARAMVELAERPPVAAPVLARERAYADARDHGTRRTRALIGRAIGDFSTYGELDALVDPAGLTVLDYGCGDGRDSIALARRGANLVVGLDVSPSRIARARTAAVEAGVAHRVTFLVGDAHDTGFPDACFDLVRGNSVMHHLDLVRALQEIRRIVRPDGHAHFVEPLAHNLLLRVGRVLTPNARSADEHPLTVDDWRTCAEIFSTFRHFERELVTVPLMPFNLVLPARGRRALADRVRVIDRRVIERVPAMRRYARLTFLVLQ